MDQSKGIHLSYPHYRNNNNNNFFDSFNLFFFIRIFDEGIFKFHGIPYAVPPLGSKRWKYAEPLDQIDKCWNGTLKAYNRTSTCWQIYMEPNRKWRIDGAENCLTLDVILFYFI